MFIKKTKFIVFKFANKFYKNFFYDFFAFKKRGLSIPQRIIYKIKKNYLLAIIVLLGFFCRWYGIYFDYPRVDFIWDETYNISHILEILNNKSLFLERSPSPYPFLSAFLYIPAIILRIIYISITNSLYSLIDLKNFILIEGVGIIHIVARWYSVFFGTATIIFINRIFSFIFKNKYTLNFLTFAYTVSLIPVYLSHWGKVHIIMVFFFILSLYFALVFEKRKECKFLYFSAISAALSLSVHYIGIASIIFPLYAIYVNKKEISVKFFLKLSGLYIAVAAFFYSLNYKGFIYMLGDAFKYYSKAEFAGLLPIGGYERFYYMIRDYFNLDPVFLTIFVVLFVLNFKFLIKNKYSRYIVAGLAFYYLLLITIIAAAQMPRWLLIFSTLAVPLSAGLFSEMLLKIKIKRFFIIILHAAVIVPSIFITFNWLKLLNNNTYLEAENWLGQNLVNKEIVYSFDPIVYNPPSYDTAVWDKEKNNLESKKNNHILSQKNNFQNNKFIMIYDRGGERYVDLAGDGTDYVLIGSGHETILQEVEKHHNLKLIKIFKPTEDEEIIQNGIDSEYLNRPINWKSIIKLDKSGPFIYVYELI